MTLITSTDRFESKHKNPSHRQWHLRPVGRLQNWRRPREHTPRLIFNAQAWLKLQYLCHLGDTEVGAFAISDQSNPLRIIDLALIKQSCTSVSVEFDDESVADYFETQVDHGRSPDSFARIWVHTHPGDSPDPSGLDEETFARVFGPCSWAVMFILARGGATYCRLRISATGRHPSGPAPATVALSAPIAVEIDYRGIADAANELAVPAWQHEYKSNVSVEPEWNLMTHRDRDEPGQDRAELDELLSQFAEFGDLDGLLRDEPNREFLEEMQEMEGGLDAE